jgi:hypothetical protein
MPEASSAPETTAWIAMIAWEDVNVFFFFHFCESSQ